MIVDQYGAPYPRVAVPVPSKNGKAKTKSVSGVHSFHSVSDWLDAYAQRELAPSIKARKPFEYHAWVFAAAMTTSVVASQAPFTVFRETEDQLERRRRKSLRHYGRWHGPRRGKRRRAIQRHLKSTQQRLLQKGLEPDEDHPLIDVLLDPNPFQVGNQIFQLTFIWLAIRGECMWVLEGEDGQPYVSGSEPARIWPLSPDLFEPILTDGIMGELAAWRFCPPVWMNKRLQGSVLELSLDEVVQFKFPNPENPIRGLSKIGAVVTGVETDLLAREYNRSVIKNGGDPGGVLTYDDSLTRDEESAYLDKWNQRHEGPGNAHRTALLSDGFKYQPVAMSPRDLEYLETLKWDRDEILAVLNVPRSVLSITEYINYATQLGQDANFWDKNIIPMFQMIESTLDKTLFFESPDNVLGAFDVKDIEALRAGVLEKIAIADQMCQGNLHVPPRVAFEVLGMEVPEYEEDESAFVGAGLQTVEQMMEEPEEPVMPSGMPGMPFDDPEEDEDEEEDPPANEAAARKNRVVIFRASRWEQFVDVETAQEGKMRRAYSSWVGEEKRIALERFDQMTSGLRLFSRINKNVDPKRIIPDLRESQNRLKEKTRPTYESTLEQTYNFTLDDVGGVTVFELDAPELLEILDRREKLLLDKSPRTLRNNALGSLVEGIQQNETIQQLRIRLAEAYGISASSAKTLQVARTETAALMNASRNTMFDLGGWTLMEWVTAGDEVVRENHVLYGRAGPQPRGFDYLQLGTNAGAGSLTFPHDFDAPAGEVINCRCLMIPIE